MNATFYSPVSIIIPNYNGVCLLRKNLPTVLAALQAYPGGGELIVVDDGSRDDSVKVLEAEFPGVHLVRHERNKGFSEAVHSGVAAASNEYLIFLNSDVQPQTGFIRPLLRHLATADVFAVSPLIVGDSGDVHTSSLNCYSIDRGRLRRIEAEWALPPREGPPRPSLYASGGSMALKKSGFLELGGFLPIFYPFYWEDFDLGVRAWCHGWRILLEPASVVVHQDHGSIKENVAKRKIRRSLQRNKMLVEWVHLPMRELVLLFLPRLVLKLIVRTLIGDPGFVRALAEALAKLPEVAKIRAANAANPGQRNLLQALHEIKAENARLFRDNAEQPANADTITPFP